MEENERKSKMPVKPIVAGLFILAAVSVLAYAGYVYHRNSQRDEAMIWAQQSLELRSKFDLNGSFAVEHLRTTMKRGLCARKWRSVHITRLSGKRRIRCAWRPAVVLSVAGS